jgi:uncharacterized protein YerC
MRAISTDKRNQIISLLNSGQSVRKVSEKVGVSIGTVSNISRLECSGRKLCVESEAAKDQRFK